MNKKVIIGMTFVLSVLELWLIIRLDLLNYIQKCLKNLNIESDISDVLSLITPCGLFFGINYYVVAPLLYLFGVFILHALFKDRWLTQKFNDYICSLCNWLCDLTIRWGTVNTARSIQHANLCEGLIAFEMANCYTGRRTVFQNALTILKNKVDADGLTSKTLTKKDPDTHLIIPTVSSTSLALSVIAGLPHNYNYLDDGEISKYNDIAKHLWECRSEWGWGVFVEKTQAENCSFTLTLRALRALNKYPISKEVQFNDYVRSIYEHSVKGKFCFNKNDEPRVVTTALGIILYFELSEAQRKNIDPVYDIDNAIKFVYEKFVDEGRDFEIETMFGIRTMNKGARFSPWYHIAVGYEVQALVLAYANRHMHWHKFNALSKRIDLICKERIRKVNGNQSYYLPENIQYSPDGIYTYPTMYLIYALGSYINQSKRKKKRTTRNG